MKQMIDGKEVDLTPSEIAEVEEREAEWEATRQEREKPNPAELREAAITALILDRAGKASPPAEVTAAAAILKKS